jgi:hypothetical protein
MQTRAHTLSTLLRAFSHEEFALDPENRQRLSFKEKLCSLLDVRDVKTDVYHHMQACLSVVACLV